MKILTAVFAAAALTIALPTLADDAVLVKNKCNVCHDATAKKVGPSWKDVNAKNKDIATVVKDAVTNGSMGKFGKIPMPKQPNAVADIAALAKAIESHK